MTANTSVSETLNKAADLIEERGWGQGPYSLYGEGGLCIEGAIAAAVMGYIADRDDTAPYAITQGCPAGQALYDYLNVGRGAGAICRFAWMWNDAEARTAAEVIEVLRATAVIEAARETETAEATA